MTTFCILFGRNSQKSSSWAPVKMIWRIKKTVPFPFIVGVHIFSTFHDHNFYGFVTFWFEFVRRTEWGLGCSFKSIFEISYCSSLLILFHYNYFPNNPVGPIKSWLNQKKSGIHILSDFWSGLILKTMNWDDILH